MTSIDNETRAERARAAMAAYQDEHDEDDAPLSDLLADLMHLVGRREFNKSLLMAEIHYNEER